MKCFIANYMVHIKAIISEERGYFFTTGACERPYVDFLVL